jgi:hypothetical protein
MTRVLESNTALLAKRVLIADASFEAAVALVLSGVFGRAHWWLNVDRSITLAGAVVFAVVAVGLGFIAFRPVISEQFIRILATANLAGGAAIWGAALLKWSRFEPGGHWLVAFVADGCLCLGALELLLLRRSRT